MGRGQPINMAIVDSTGTLAARTCAAGMMTGMNSPARPWFKLGIDGFSLDQTSNPISLWLAEVESRMYKVFQESNFYNSMAQLYFDLVVFGSASMLIYEDYDDIIRCFNPALGEFYLSNGPRGDVNTFYREFTMTVAALVEKFGEDKVSEGVQSLFNGKGANLEQEIVVRHAIQPNFSASGIPKEFPYVEFYWEWGSANRGNNGNPTILSSRPFYDPPFVAARWDIVADDAYGRSPGMDALGDIKQLQQEQRRKGQAIDKMVNPPLMADVALKNQPASLIPGGITYVAGLQNSGGMKPVYEVQPRIAEMTQDIREVQERIQRIFFNDLFLMIANLSTVRTATEIDALREEKLVMLGPVIQRLENEVLDPIIDRVFNIMQRTGLLPEPPEEIAGQQIKVNYISFIAEAQRASATTSIERVLALTGNLTAVYPDVKNVVNATEAIVEYATLLRVSPKMIRSVEERQALMEAEAQQAQMAQMAQMGVAGVQGAKLLSETQTGGGQNALQLMLGNGSLQ